MGQIEKRKWLTFALCVLAVVLVLFIVSFFVPIYGEICAKDEYTNTKECTSHHIALVAFWQIIKAANDWSAAITAFATLAIGGFTWQLKRSTDKLFVAGEKQRKVSKKAVQAAHDANELARNDNRPWLRFKLIEAKGGIGQDGNDYAFEAEASIENLGQTPALGVSVVQNVFSSSRAYALWSASNHFLSSVERDPPYDKGKIMYPGEAIPSRLSFTGIIREGLDEPVQGLFWCCVILYRSLGGTQAHHTVNVFEVKQFLSSDGNIIFRRFSDADRIS